MTKDGSKFVSEGIEVSYDIELAKKFQPEIYDPEGYSGEETPTSFFRVLTNGTKRCIQYYYYWKKQEGKDYKLEGRGTIAVVVAFWPYLIIHLIIIGYLAWDYFTSRILAVLDKFTLLALPWLAALLFGIIAAIFYDPARRWIGGFFGKGFFTHAHDFEPILIFLDTEDKVERIVASGMGDVQSIPHRNDIFISDIPYSCSNGHDFEMSKEYQDYGTEIEGLNKPLSRYGHTYFYIDQLGRLGDKPKFRIATCFHAFRRLENMGKVGTPMEIDLVEMNDSELAEWFNKRDFGHDVFDPFTFPHIKYCSPKGSHTEEAIERRKTLKLLGYIGKLIEYAKKAEGTFRGEFKKRYYALLSILILDIVIIVALLF